MSTSISNHNGGGVETAEAGAAAAPDVTTTVSDDPPAPPPDEGEPSTHPRPKDPPPGAAPNKPAADGDSPQHPTDGTLAKKKAKSRPHKKKKTRNGMKKKDPTTSRRMYRDSVLVEIPLGGRTADLSSVVATCRERALGRIYTRYPQLDDGKSKKARHELGSGGGGGGAYYGAGNGGSSPLEGSDDEAVEEGGSEKQQRKPSGSAAAAAAGESSKEDAADNLSSSGGVHQKPSLSESPDSQPKKKKAAASRPPSKQPHVLPKHVPQKKDYGGMLEYLEAKYVQGVMVPDGRALDEEGASDEGGGSVYSDNSFFDDTDLQRGVASQVLAHSTTTRVELLAASSSSTTKKTAAAADDDDFFVNVGNLEVEESEFTKDHYDPLADVDPKKAAKKPATKKRKKVDDQGEGGADGAAAGPAKAQAASSSGTASSAAPAAKKTKKAKTAPADSDKKSKASKDASSKDGKKASASKARPSSPARTASPTVTPSSPSNADTTVKGSPADSAAAAAAADSGSLKAVADEKKERVDDLYDRLVRLIPTETFPKRKTKERVLLRCPDDKKPGDSVLFSNPHVPGQRLKVSIPKTAKPGGTFKAHVPFQEDLDETADYNKLSREFHLLIDDYARAFDDWCDALGAYRKSVDGNDCSAHFEKRTKFDRLSGEFPTDLKTPVDKAYLQKILRRARQNRSKRENNAKRGEALPASASASVTASPAGSAKSEAKGAAAVAASSSSSTSAIHAKAQEMIRRHSLTSASAKNGKDTDAADKKGGKPDASRTKPMGIPSLFRDFMRKRFNEADFALEA